MGIEIERKFLLKNDNWKQDVSTSAVIKQGYLAGSDKSSVRIRIEGDKANINIKSMTLAITRQEYEYSIPLDDAEKLLQDLCEQPQINKTRYIVKYKEHKWEIDVFSGDNEGLVVAEIELKSEDEAFSIPEWIGEEVSEQVKYYNVNLIKYPFSSWSS
ncbi:Adenylate cyclase [hydrothermal vent metagenome]|uniref:Adenylate cyclase n=1 Tax=hydrothermal vent metagenome TaxID=652676 RepID=A0A3B0ZCS6_9ZZZZ